MPNDIIPGFFGKLPQLGDFVSRRLPPYFVKPWDTWLQEAVSLSQKQLGGDWRDCYLASPVWRFILGPDLCGSHGAVGILVPSVDKVGRCFPLTIAALAPSPLSHLMLRAVQWFSQLEVIAGLVMTQKIDFKVFDRRLRQVKLPMAMVNYKEHIADTLLSPANDPLFFRLEMQRFHQLPGAYEYLMGHLLERHLNTFSLWSSKGTAQNSPVLTVFRGLPPPDRYVQFLADLNPPAP